jgi:hypothetical protein
VENPTKQGVGGELDHLAQRILPAEEGVERLPVN